MEAGSGGTERNSVSASTVASYPVSAPKVPRPCSPTVSPTSCASAASDDVAHGPVLAASHAAAASANDVVGTAASSRSRPRPTVASNAQAIMASDACAAAAAAPGSRTVAPGSPSVAPDVVGLATNGTSASPSTSVATVVIAPHRPKVDGPS